MAERDAPQPSDQAALETDPRFPSGRWKGYYIQWGMRGWQDLTLQFKDGAIEGIAVDKGGESEIHGAYDLTAGTVSLVKIYYYHKVEYRGACRDRGIRGGFMIRYPRSIDAGDFYIWPAPDREQSANALTAAASLHRT